MIRAARYCGMKPPAHVVAALRKHHPMVHLLWSEQIKRWVLTQVYPGAPKVLKILAKHYEDRDHEFERPNLDNTVRWLYDASPANKHNKWALDRWIQGVDEKAASARSSETAAARDRIEEGHDRLWHSIAKRTVIQKNFDGRIPQRQASR